MQYRTRIKICGMTQPGSVRDAVNLGVDAIGMILHAESPRTISIEQAIRLRREVPSFVSLIGVFVDAEPDLIRHYHNAIGLDAIQLHGDESPEFADELCLPYIKAIRAKNRQQVESTLTRYPAAQGVLLDPYVKGMHGGTGKVLETDIWPRYASETRVILAGGLSALNIKQRVSELRPYAVDVNSGVELSPGVKSTDLMRQVVERVGQSDKQNHTGVDRSVDHV